MDTYPQIPNWMPITPKIVSLFHAESQLDFVKGHVFDPADFVIRADGVCRRNPENGANGDGDGAKVEMDHQKGGQIVGARG